MASCHAWSGVGNQLSVLVVEMRPRLFVAPAPATNTPPATSVSVNVELSSVLLEMVSPDKPFTFRPSVTVAALLATTSESNTLGVVLPVWAQGIPKAQSPEEVGFLSTRLKRLSDRINEGVKSGEIPGAVVLIGRAAVAS